MAEINTTDLNDSLLNPLPWFSFLRAEWWDDTSRFALVRYALKGREQELGLRLDLDKKIFLDHMDEPDLDKFVQSKATEISRRVAKQRLIWSFARPWLTT